MIAPTDIAALRTQNRIVNESREEVFIAAFKLMHRHTWDAHDTEERLADDIVNRAQRWVLEIKEFTEIGDDLVRAAAVDEAIERLNRGAP